MLNPCAGTGYAAHCSTARSLSPKIGQAKPRAKSSAPSHHGSRGQGHAALRIDDADYDAWKVWLVERGVEIEMEVKWPPGGRSIYFRDPAGNSVELAAGDVWGSPTS